MDSIYIFSCPFLPYENSHSRSRKICIHKPLYTSQPTMMAVATVEPIARRSANYDQSLWSFDFVQSLSSSYTGENCSARSLNLKEAVKMLIHERSSKVENPLGTLELVDDLQRLGISYHFKDEIRDILEMIYYNYYKTHDKWNKMDLNLKALGFRLLRQHGNHVPQEIFHDIKDQTQNLEAHSYKDMVGMLNLYEASYLSVEDESALDEVRDFTSKYLEECLEKNIVAEQTMLSMISHALELPLHWRVPRVEAKWFMEVYEKRSGMNHTLIELAKLDFNMVQAIHQEDLKYTSRWWRTTCWDKKFSFARDRLVENFLWATGINYLPSFGYGRRILTKVIAIITTIDDVYDVYGTLEELERFTNVTSSWDVDAIEELPDYMKICFLGFLYFINEIGYNTLTNTGLFIIPYLKKRWAALCKSYLVEARWYHNRHTPTLEEYLDNSYISVAAPVALMHAYFLTSSCITEEALECMENADNIVHYSCLIMRLANDLGTSSDELERGDVPKSIKCYMRESGASEEEARTYLKVLINNTWRKLNKARKVANSPFSKSFIEFATNLARMAQFMYGNGDRHDCPYVTKSHVLSLLIDPIQEVQ